MISVLWYSNKHKRAGYWAKDPANRQIFTNPGSQLRGLVRKRSSFFKKIFRMDFIFLKQRNITFREGQAHKFPAKII